MDRRKLVVYSVCFSGAFFLALALFFESILLILNIKLSISTDILRIVFLAIAVFDFISAFVISKVLKNKV